MGMMGIFYLSLKLINMTINNQDYKLKYTLRALFIFEQITGKLFNLETVTDQYIFFYSMLMANNPDMKLTFDEFIDALDEDPTVMKEFVNFLNAEKDKYNVFQSSSDDKKKF